MRNCSMGLVVFQDRKVLEDFVQQCEYMYYWTVYFKMGISGDSVVKNLPARQEAQVWFQGQEDTLEKEMATHSSILAWEIP